MRKGTLDEALNFWLAKGSYDESKQRNTEIAEWKVWKSFATFFASSALTWTHFK